MTERNLDPRRNAFRSDLADSRLRSQVTASRYVDGQSAQLAQTTPVRRAPETSAMMISEALAGETAQVFEVDKGWAWVQLYRDSYVGYVSADALAQGITFSTHQICAPRALHFPQPDLKTPPIGCSFLGAEIALGPPDGEYISIASGGYLHARTVAPLGTKASDFASVAERFIGTTYLWGGKTANGLDCSGLVQVAMHAAGLDCPRDSDMQMAEVGLSLGSNPEATMLQRGDLVFWDGHVGIMTDPETLLHANAWHMETAREPLAQAVARIAESGSPVLDIRRPVTRQTGPDT